MANFLSQFLCQRSNTGGLNDWAGGCGVRARKMYPHSRSNGFQPWNSQPTPEHENIRNAVVLRFWPGRLRPGTDRVLAGARPADGACFRAIFITLCRSSAGCPPPPFFLASAFPEEFGGASGPPRHHPEAAIRMRDASRKFGPPASMSGASALHMNIFGLNPGPCLFLLQRTRKKGPNCCRRIGPGLEGKHASPV